jgi:hypothetical protein
MKPAFVVALVLAAGPCATPQPMTATVSAVASTQAKVGDPVQLVVKVTNTGPVIPHVGLVFRTGDRWFDRHQVKDLSGCTVATEQSAFDCGDLAAGDSRSFSFQGVATTAGTFHYELALRELVQPYDWVNEHSDGPDAQTWDETVS